MSWLGFTGVFALFFATHSIPVRPPVRRAVVRLVGERGFTLAYSALSLVMLAAVIVAAARAPYVQLWPQMLWQRHVVLAGMFAVCVIVALSLGRPNPFSFGGAHNERFDPAHPGIVRLFRHPVLVALALWAGLHLLPNGDLAHVILFGIFTLFAIAGRSLINRRKTRQMGRDAWERLDAEVARQPLVSVFLPVGWVFWRLCIAVAVYVSLLALHPVVIGVPAL